SLAGGGARAGRPRGALPGRHRLRAAASPRRGAAVACQKQSWWLSCRRDCAQSAVDCASCGPSLRFDRPNPLTRPHTLEEQPMPNPNVDRAAPPPKPKKAAKKKKGGAK